MSGQMYRIPASRSRQLAFGRIMMILLVVLALAGVGLQSPDRVAHAATYFIVFTSDASPGFQCELREAIRSANTNTGIDNCPEGSDTETDVIQLVNGETYILDIPGGDNTAEAGDLDIVDNSAELDLIIRTSDPDGDPATIDASSIPGGDRVLQVLTGASVHVENIVITGGSTAFNGGGIFNNGTLELLNSSVTGNEGTDATFEAGGIANSIQGRLTLDNTSVTNNAMVNGGNGGGIVNRNSLFVTNGTLIAGNSTQGGDGGGLYNSGSATITNSQIGQFGSSNGAVGTGGGIYNTADGSLAMQGSTLISNTATEDGGGIYNAGTATISDASAIGGDGTPNVADDDGGGLFNAANATMTISDSSIIGNRTSPLSGNADAVGAGIANFGQISLNNTTVVRNLTSNGDNSRGGGIWNRGTLTMNGGEVAENATGAGSAAHGGGIANVDGTMQLTDVTVRENTTGAGVSLGGGIWNASQLRLSNTTVTTNTTTGDGAAGGGITNTSNGVLEIVESIIRQNNTGDGVVSPGGGIWNVGDLTMADSDVSENYTGNGINSYGGGIAVSSGNVTLSNVTVRDNYTGTGGSSYGGGIGMETALAHVTIEDSTISGNWTGAGLDNGNDGGGIYNEGILNLRTITITDNEAGGENNDGGGLYNAAGGIVSIDQTVIDTNRASTTGNGADGGGIFNLGTLAMRNSTVSNNTARTIGGGIYTGNGSDLTILFSTVTANTTEDGTAGGLWVDNGVSSAILRGSIIAGNSANFNPDYEDVVNTVTSEGYNLIGIGDGGMNLVNGVNGDQVGSTTTPLTAQIGPLADNGGSTRSHALLAGSPALDVVPAAMCVDLGMVAFDSDQRGEPRPAGLACDVGAYEDGASNLIYLPIIIR